MAAWRSEDRISRSLFILCLTDSLGQLCQTKRERAIRAMFVGDEGKRKKRSEIKGLHAQRGEQVGFIDRDENGRQKKNEKQASVLLKTIKVCSPDFKLLFDKRGRHFLLGACCEY